MGAKPPQRVAPWIVCVLLLGTGSRAEAQSDGRAAFEQQGCPTCHQTRAVAADAFDPSARSQRQGPLLAHAGVKYRRAWLVAWLQEPYRIRPAGAYPPAAVAAGPDEKDVIVDSTLEPHSALAAERAESIADYLSTLAAGSDRVAAVAPRPQKLPTRIATLNFRKFKGCIACHQDADGNGGLSGPELFTAWSRATPEYLFSYIQDATAWDRHTMMPVLGLNDVEINKLLGYLQSISHEETP